MNLGMLNLGCGSRFSVGWTNVNFTATGPDVIAANLGLGIPFPNNSFDNGRSRKPDSIYIETSKP